MVRFWARYKPIELVFGEFGPIPLQKEGKMKVKSFWIKHDFISVQYDPFYIKNIRSVSLP